ncbi:MAG TPA: MGMT family protein [Armatimonadota bacterium]|jgi:methylated-DNA-protein-cysteine methyltransferase-like protein
MEGRPSKGVYPRVYDAVREVPAGRVTSYGRVAERIGSYGAARMVGWALRQLPEGSGVPWWRVINAQGYISIVHPEASADKQRELLEAEGVCFERRGGLWHLIDTELWW